MRTFSDPIKQKIYRAWVDMRNRCDNANAKEYPNYGGRGIVYCHAWRSFETFYQDMLEGCAEGLSLGRKDNNANYTPANCRWETPTEQQRNRRSVVLDEAKVAIIRQRLALRHRNKDIAADLEIPAYLVSFVKTGKAWRNGETS